MKEQLEKLLAVYGLTLRLAQGARYYVDSRRRSTLVILEETRIMTVGGIEHASAQKAAEAIIRELLG